MRYRRTRKALCPLNRFRSKRGHPTRRINEPLRDVEVTIRCEPAFAETMRLRFDRLDAGETRRLDSVDLKFEHRYLAELTAAERGRVVVEVRAGGIEVL